MVPAANDFKRQNNYDLYAFYCPGPSTLVRNPDIMRALTTTRGGQEDLITIRSQRVFRSSTPIYKCRHNQDVDTIRKREAIVLILVIVYRMRQGYGRVPENSTVPMI